MSMGYFFLQKFPAVGGQSVLYPGKSLSQGGPITSMFLAYCTGTPGSVRICCTHIPERRALECQAMSHTDDDDDGVVG